uniref:Ig-like domain-containing protein n=1 Tax=Paramormyrops kingsleyae TaxID=1676925 RepID=A0A3B3SZE5_9TELE
QDSLSSVHFKKYNSLLLSCLAASVSAQPLLSLFVSLTVPTDVSARLGEPATLPCYVPVDKTQRSNTDTVHWEKDGQTVLLLQSGSSNKSSGFENRYSMSVDKVRFGDLSLTISKVRYSDQGTYQCFSTEKTNLIDLDHVPPQSPLLEAEQI